MNSKKIRAAIERDRAAEQLAHALLRANGHGEAVDAHRARAASVGLDASTLPHGFQGAQRGTPDAIAQSLGFLSADEIHGASAILDEGDEP